MLTRAARLLGLSLLMLAAGCGASPDADETRRLDEAAAVVIETVDRTLAEWESAAAAAIDGGTPQVPAGIAVVVIGAGAVMRSDGAPLPFPPAPMAERPARESLTPDARAAFPVAEVIADRWSGWQKTAGGRAAEARGQSGVAAVWRTAGDRIAIAAGPIALLSKAAAPRLDALRVRAGIEDPGRAAPSTAAAGSIVRPLDAAGLPWVVRLTPLK
jgi:hypothetical protein